MVLKGMVANVAVLPEVDLPVAIGADRPYMRRFIHRPVGDGDECGAARGLTPLTDN